MTIEDWLSIAVVVVCILLSAFFAAAETALTALGEPRTRQLIDEGRHGSLKLWLHEPERVLATLLVCNTAVTTLSASLTTSTSAAAAPTLRERTS